MAQNTLVHRWLWSHLSIREQLMWAFPSSSVRLWNSIDNDVQLMRFGLVLAVNDRVEAGKEEKPMVNGEQHWPEHRYLTKRPFKSMEWYHIHASLISEKEERTRTWKQKLALIERFSREFSHVPQKKLSRHREWEFSYWTIVTQLFSIYCKLCSLLN